LEEKIKRPSAGNLWRKPTAGNLLRRRLAFAAESGEPEERTTDHDHEKQPGRNVRTTLSASLGITGNYTGVSRQRKKHTGGSAPSGSEPNSVGPTWEKKEISRKKGSSVLSSS